MIDYNVKAERMGWLPSAPQLATNPLDIAAAAEAAGAKVPDHVAGALQSGALNCLPRSGRSGELAAQHVRLALQSSRLVGQGPRILPQAPARHQPRRAGQGPGRGRPQQARGGGVARRGTGGKARPAGDARLPHVHHLRLFRHRAADGDLVREERPQHLRHAPVHPSADRGGGPGLGVAVRLGDLQGDRARHSPSWRRRCWASNRTWC